MLTATDIHYLVGLLTRASHAEDIEIELGDLVHDEAANIKRDIDITVTQRNDGGTISEYRGIEVKRHKRRLTVEHVEQLCRKFSDLPSITHKAIVSASGYTDAAIRKGSHHGVDLLEIRACPDPLSGFDHINFQEGACRMAENVLTWERPPQVTPLIEENNLAAFQKVMKRNPRIVDASCGQFDDSLKLSDLINKVAVQVMDAEVQSNGIAPNTMKDISTRVHFSQGLPHVLAQRKLVPILGFEIIGKIKSELVNHEPEFRILIEVGSAKQPISGCAIFELRSGNLMGFSISNANRNINAVNIPLRERFKKKILKQRLD